MTPLNQVLSDEEIATLEQAIIEIAEKTGGTLQEDKLERLRQAQVNQPAAAKSLLRVVRKDILPLETAEALLAEIFEAQGGEAEILPIIGDSLEYASDCDDLNRAPPAAPVFPAVIEKLASQLPGMEGSGEEEDLLRGLATAARMMGRQQDGLAGRCYRRLAELRSGDSGSHYSLGLWCKTRGHFLEGMKANQTAAALLDEPNDATEWNLGICATGAGEGAVALEVWKRMGQIIEMGRFDLPEGGYPVTKVRLAERPLAERGPEDDDPGLEETIWIERLSPCHGIIRSVLYGDLGVDFGDVILFDGAPITYHKYGETEYPVFPHLATLHRRNYQFFDFAGTQVEAGQLADVSRDLERDALVYSHSENFKTLCRSCWRDPDLDHEEHVSEEKHVVTGRIAAPADLAPGFLLEQIDAALKTREPARIYAPGLCEAAGFEDRASVETRRFNMLTGN